MKKKFPAWIILMIFCLVAAAALAVTNLLTRDVIADNAAKESMQTRLALLPGSETFEDLENGVSAGKDKDGNIIGYAATGAANGFGGEVESTLVINSDGTIAGISVGGANFAETAGLGARAKEPEFAAQFVGKTAPVALTQNGGQIDALTGATITSKAVVNGVNDAYARIGEVAGFEVEAAPAAEETGNYTVYNKTGETVTEITVTNNTTGEVTVAATDMAADAKPVTITYTAPEGTVITLGFKTESGREAAFDRLHIETAPITLLAPDAMTGATPISFFAPEATGEYTVYNKTGETVKEITMTNNATGEVTVVATDMAADAEPVPVTYTAPEGTVITLGFKTESGREAAFDRLHIETAPITLLAPDAMTGATPISFFAPEQDAE